MSLTLARGVAAKYVWFGALISLQLRDELSTTRVSGWIQLALDYLTCCLSVRPTRSAGGADLKLVERGHFHSPTNAVANRNQRSVPANIKRSG